MGAGIATLGGGGRDNNDSRYTFKTLVLGKGKFQRIFSWVLRIGFGWQSVIQNSIIIYNLVLFSIGTYKICFPQLRDF